MKLNIKTLLIPITIALIASCSGKQEKASSEEQVSTVDSDSVAMMNKAIELAHKFIITDGHIDLPYRLHDEWEDVSLRTEGGDFDYVRAKEGGLDAPFMSIYVDPDYQDGRAKAVADTLIDIVEKLVASNPGKFALAFSPADVESNFEKGLISLPMGMENGAPIEGDLENVKYFANKGIRYITLTHGKRNHICDSSYDPDDQSWGGLSPFGKEVILEMNKQGIMVDISHVSDSTFYQVLRLSKAPPICSHTSCRHFTKGFERNASDDMIKKLAERDGVIQINFGSWFLDQEVRDRDSLNEQLVRNWAETNELNEEDNYEQIRAYKDSIFDKYPTYSTVQVVVDHIDHVVEIAGIDHVGFGSDFDGVGDSLPIGIKDASQYPNLIFELLKRGYSEEDIEKICFKNVWRVWKEVEKVASQLQEG